VTSYPNPAGRPESVREEDRAVSTPAEGLMIDDQAASEPATGGVAGSGPDSKKEAASAEATEIKDTAVAAGADVAETAKQEASQVAQEAGAQARSLLDQLRAEVRDQGSGRKEWLASTLHSFSKELGSMASRSEENGPVTDLAHQASRKSGEVAHWLDNHEPAEVLDQVKAFARRRPFAFLALCAAAGVVAGRITRGAVAANTSLDTPEENGVGRPVEAAPVVSVGSMNGPGDLYPADGGIEARPEPVRGLGEYPR
jgi:hypothetical protein